MAFQGGLRFALQIAHRRLFSTGFYPPLPPQQQTKHPACLAENLCLLSMQSTFDEVLELYE